MATDKTIWECPVYTLVSQLDGAQRLVIQASNSAVQDNSVPIGLLGQWMAQNNNISIYNGSANPDNALGNNGDLYFQSNSKIYQKLGGVWVLKATGSVKWGAISGTLSDQTDLQTALDAKVDKAIGFGLSSNDYTSAEKSKLSALSEHYVGYYASLAALNTAHPTGLDGQYATVDAGSGHDALNYIWDDNDNAWVKSGGAGAVTSVNSQVGAVVLTTDNVGEGSTNKYFTVARVLATVLTGISFGTLSAALATDTLLVALGKLQAQITDIYLKVLPTGGSTGQALIKNSATNYDVVWGAAGAAINDSAASTTTVYSSTKTAALVTAEATARSSADALLAPLASPALTGAPTAPTATALDNSTKIATTAYVDVAVAAQAKKTIIGSFQSII